MSQYYIEFNSCFHPLTDHTIEDFRGSFLDPLNREILKKKSKVVLGRFDDEGKFLSIESQVYPKRDPQGLPLPRVLTASVVKDTYIEIYQCPVYFNGLGIPIILSRQGSHFWQNTRLLNLKLYDEHTSFSSTLPNSAIQEV